MTSSEGAMIGSGTPGSIGAGLAGASVPPVGTAQTTGRYVVVLAEPGTNPGPMLQRTAGLDSVADSRDFEDQRVDLDETGRSDGTTFAELGVAVVAADPSQIGALRASSEARDAIISVSPELIYHVLPETNADYLQGYVDGVGDLGARLGATATGAHAARRTATPTVSFEDSAQFTWGLQATKSDTSTISGLGVKVAVLDTGFDADHPDFAGRLVTTASFVPNESPDDGHGHGTHCIGTACGSQRPETGPRYGVAYDAEIFAGKVLGNAGSGSDEGIIAGINWAVTNGCHIISMSLGADVPEVHPPYTVIGRRALDAGSLIIAAAGNNADRRAGDFGFVGAPANSPFIMAVGALDKELITTFFSARTLPVNGGQVDVAGPGWKVYSSWPMPTRYNTISGTSMATPHVAGLAALWAQVTGFRGRELWATLAQESQRLLEPSVDVGSGLVLAPQ